MISEFGDLLSAEHREAVDTPFRPSIGPVFITFDTPPFQEVPGSGRPMCIDSGATIVRLRLQRRGIPPVRLSLRELRSTASQALAALIVGLRRDWPVWR